MQIMIINPAGITLPITATKWSPLADAIATIASRPKTPRARRELAVLAWCRRGGLNRPAVDEVVIDGNTATLEEYDADADFAAAQAFVTPRR